MSHHHNFFIMSDYVDNYQEGVQQLMNAVAMVSSNVESRKAYKNTRKLMAYQQELNEESWQKQLDYNTPANQRQRLEQAGINPMWSGAVDSGNAQSFANTGLNAAPNNAELPLKAAQLANESRSTSSQIALNKETEKLQRAQAENAYADARVKDETANSLAIQNANKQTEYNWLFQEKEASINKMVQEVENLKSQKEYQDIVNDSAVEMIQADIDKALAEGDLARAKEITENKLRDYIARKYNAEIAEKYVSCQKLKNDMAVDWYKADTERLDVNNRYHVELAKIELENKKFNLLKEAQNHINDLVDAQKEYYGKQSEKTGQEVTEIQYKNYLNYTYVDMMAQLRKNPRLYKFYKNALFDEFTTEYNNIKLRGKMTAFEAKTQALQFFSNILTRVENRAGSIAGVVSGGIGNSYSIQPSQQMPNVSSPVWTTNY